MLSKGSRAKFGKIFYAFTAALLLFSVLPVFITPSLAQAGETKTFNISAIDVVIAINRFGDNDPLGKMFVLDENIAAVRAQEAIPLSSFDRVKIGLRDDTIQPLVIRANIGDTVVVNFTNNLTAGNASFHIQGMPVTSANLGSNVGNNPDTTVPPGGTRTYTFQVPNQINYEGAYVFNSMGDPRAQQAHGLFGVLNVEPAGSTYLNPITGQPEKSGWDAIIVDPNGRDFREDTIIYHEFGDETFLLSDKNGAQLPLNPAMDGATNYRPGSRLLNYRSEEFFRRDELVATVLQIPIGGVLLNQSDESQDYGSYMNGDPPTPIPRGYVGDPTKRRIVNAGSERFHMEHLHGGSDRWPLDPFVEPDFWGLPFDKTAVEQSLSTRLDSQGVGPGEAYTIQPEGAAGGLQAIAGEFLFHCHFGHHYIGGMWSFWRVFDTLQTADNGLFGNPAMAELPDRAGLTPLAVNSIGLLGRTLTFADGTSGRTLTLGATSNTTLNIDEWVRSILPPQGVPGPYDASVWDWTANVTPQGPLYLSEPETTLEWENYTSPAPGQRLEIKFNPKNGRLAFPLLRPHLGKRPPFSPGRSGAPYAGDTTDRDGSARVDQEHPDSMVPAAARRIEYTAVTILTPVTFNQQFNITQNPTGALLVLDEDKADILAGIKPKEQLTLRARVGDGVDVILYSEANDGVAFATSKANIHIHFVQFDTQASDGVISGLSYEQSVRSYQQEGAAGTGIRLTADAPAGSTNITVDDASTLQVNAFVGVGFGVTRRNGDGGNLAGTLNSNGGFEYAQITAKNGNTLTLDRPLLNNHTTGQFVGVEFVRYQWYSDAESGTTFYHNHVNGIPGFGIALTGALIQEPVGARWTNPATDAEVRSGSQVVIHTPTQVAAGIPAQDFREQVLHFMGSSFNIPRGAGGETGAVNMRQQPLSRLPGDPSLLFSSVTHADPETPVLNAYVGDLVTFRIMNSSGHDDMSFKIAGHRFRLERNDVREQPKDALSIGISERFDVFMTAGSVGLQAGDYVFTNGMQEKMMDGAWGILRVSDTLQPNLLPLQNVRPTHPPLRPPGPDTFPRNTPGIRGQLGPAPPVASEPSDVAGLKTKLELNGYSLMGGLPVGQIPVRTYDVVAIQTNITFSPTLTNGAGRAYVLAEDEAAVLAGTKPLEPLVLRANIGEIVRVNFANHLPADRASFSVPQLIKTADSIGAAFGLDNDSTVAPGVATPTGMSLTRVSRYRVPSSSPTTVTRWMELLTACTDNSSLSRLVPYTLTR